MVDGELYERYSSAVSALDKLIRTKTIDNLDAAIKAVNQGVSYSVAAQALYLGLLKSKRKNAGLAAQVALEFYKNQREKHGAKDGYEPTFLGTTPDEWLLADFKQTIQAHRDDASIDFDGMKAALTARMAHYAVKAVDATIIGNARRDPLHPKWAFVPHVGACAWCIMIGSNDFYFNSNKTAAAERHPSCTCSVVADFDTKNPHLEGYDPEGMYQRMQMVANSLGLGPWTAAMNNPKLRELISKEVRRRDGQWMLDGTKPEVDNSIFKLDKLNPDQLHAYLKDKNTAEALAIQGLRAIMVDDPLAKPKRGVPQFDFLINGIAHESKSPEGDGYLAVAGNILKADEKFLKVGEKSHIIISNLESKMSDEQFVSYYKIAKDDPASDWRNIADVTLVLKNKEIRCFYL